MRFLICALVICTFIFVGSPQLHADTYLFSFSGPNADTISFLLPSSPNVDAGSYWFFAGGLNMEWNGRLLQTGPTFRALINDGGFSMFYSPLNTGFNEIQSFFSGPQLYTLNSSSPTFLLGTFNLVELSNSLSTGVVGIPGGFGPGVLTITDVTSSPVPEPSSLALAGAGILGVVIRARRKMLNWG